MSKQRSNSPPTDSDPSRKSATQPRHQAANRPSPEPEAPRVTAPIHPYPPHQYIMNHPGGYPINGSPFTQQYPPPPPPPGTPGGPQYAYPIHSPYPPPHHYYHPQYPPQVMMYGPPPGHHQQPNTPGSAGSPVQETGTKRKRKSTSAAGRGKDKSDDEGDSSGLGAHQNQKAALDKALELKKRTKTQRACDSCRSRKIRCDILTETEPPKCQHCKQYAFDCTFFLPITETRFKKKKLDEEGADKEGKSPIAEKRDISVLGPTSTAHLLHSQASISSRIYEGYDSRYHHSFEVSKNGDGLIRVERPAQSEQQMTLPKPVDLHIEPQIVEQLLNAYFSEVAPILPIITQADFLATPAPAPILLYSMCLVAAARREVPQAVFDSIRYAVNGVIKAEDVLSTPTMANVQALLILCMTGDCHSQFVPTALSAMWARLGTAIRMAQDLGLHRAELVKHDIELRRRVWGACLISDRWTSLVYGFPYMIDVHDCDVRLPSSGDSKDMYMDELVRLSVIGGRVVKTIYSPSGLTLISDEILYKLLADIESWKANLPENLRFRGADSPQSAGILHLLYTSVCMIFWRVFMRISYSCPEHLKFGLTVEQWSLLVTMTGDSIDWLDANEKVYDVWLLFAYAATSCAFVQYHTWVRRQDTDAVQKLRKLRDCVRRWEGSISPDHMSARRKTAEIITLLYEATQGPQLPLETPALNPTAGAKGKQPQALDYKPDPSRPGAGVFIAHKDSPNDFEDLPAGVVIKDGEQEPDTKADAGAAATAGASSMVNLTPLRGSHSNVNPAMNAPANPGQVQVMNVLDVPQASNTLREFAMADTGFLEGIPGGMFDWGQWDTFFSRINPAAPGETNGGVPSVYQEQEGRQQRQE
ncbi:fungal-specific transcription factor domain-containing protein [Mycena rebaudengoi]|nr:fungal-specific transcription factor domain-containing protein [Mycena rebaudengoi]